jgi:hypothetical protein
VLRKEHVVEWKYGISHYRRRIIGKRWISRNKNEKKLEMKGHEHW